MSRAAAVSFREPVNLTEQNPQDIVASALDELKSGSSSYLRENKSRIFDLDLQDAVKFADKVRINIARLQKGLEEKEFTIGELHGLQQLDGVLAKLRQNDNNLIRFTEIGKMLSKEGFNTDAFYALVVFGFHRGEAGFVGAHTISREGLLSKTSKQIVSQTVSPKALAEALDKLIAKGIVKSNNTKGQALSLNPEIVSSGAGTIGAALEFCTNQREWIISRVGHKVGLGFSEAKPRKSAVQVKDADEARIKIVTPNQMTLNAIAALSASVANKQYLSPELISNIAVRMGEIASDPKRAKGVESEVVASIVNITANSEVRNLERGIKNKVCDAMVSLLKQNGLAINPIVDAFIHRSSGMNLITLSALLRYCENKEPAQLKTAFKCIQQATNDSSLPTNVRDEVQRQIDILCRSGKRKRDTWNSVITERH